MDWRKFPSQAPTRKAWSGMMNRCYSPTNKDYPGCGGAGITVCDRWHTYENFLSDMGEKPDGSLLARYVASTGFTPENTYWQPKVHSRTNRLYGIWKGVRRRCGVIGSSKNRNSDYVERGVTVDPDWANSFASFVMAVGEPPSAEHQLDRIDNDLGYVPGNVRWVLPKENCNNRSDNVVIEMHGKMQTLQQWCDEYGLPRSLVSGRWGLLFSPCSRSPKDYQCQQIDAKTGKVIAEFKNAKLAAEATGIRRATIQKCLSGGNATAGGFAWRYLR